MKLDAIPETPHVLEITKKLQVSVQNFAVERAVGRSTFASGSGEPQGLAFDRAGNLFVADGGGVDKFTPAGVRTTFASG
jgi:sugar lactone lactonase YvrE